MTRRLADHEILSLAGLLKLESDALAVSKAMQELITDNDLKKQAESAILAAEGRIRGL